jgi:hypothetical protein
MAWEVIASYAQYAGLLIEVGLDSKITINDNNYMIGDIVTIDQTWTRSNSANVKYLGTAPENVSQVKIPWVNHDASLSGSVVFPTSPGEHGDIFEMDEQVYDDEASALERAEQLYYRKRYPYSWLVEPAVITGLFAPRETHALSDWKFNGEMQALDRTCFVKSVEYSVTMTKTNDMRWEGVLNLVEMNRRQP